MYANCCSGTCAVGCSYTPLSIEHVGTMATTCEERGARSCCTAGKQRKDNSINPRLDLTHAHSHITLTVAGVVKTCQYGIAKIEIAWKRLLFPRISRITSVFCPFFSNSLEGVTVFVPYPAFKASYGTNPSSHLAFCQSTSSSAFYYVFHWPSILSQVSRPRCNSQFMFFYYLCSHNKH